MYPFKYPNYTEINFAKTFARYVSEVSNATHQFELSNMFRLDCMMTVLFRSEPCYDDEHTLAGGQRPLERIWRGGVGARAGRVCGVRLKAVITGPAWRGAARRSY